MTEHEFPQQRRSGADPLADLSRSPLPTARTLKARQSLPGQFIRFVAFNASIMRMVAKGKKGH